MCLFYSYKFILTHTHTHTKQATVRYNFFVDEYVIFIRKCRKYVRNISEDIYIEKSENEIKILSNTVA